MLETSTYFGLGKNRYDLRDILNQNLNELLILKSVEVLLLLFVYGNSLCPCYFHRITNYCHAQNQIIVVCFLYTLKC